MKRRSSMKRINPINEFNRGNIKEKIMFPLKEIKRVKRHKVMD